MNTFGFCRATDEFLPKVVLDATQVIFTIVGSIVIAATVNFYFLIPVLVMGILFIYVRKVYLKTAKNVKRLEGVGKYAKCVISNCLYLFHRSSLNFSKIASIYTFSSHFEWLIDHSCL